MTPSMIKDLWFMVLAYTVYLIYNIVQNENRDTFKLILEIVIMGLNVVFLLEVIFRWGVLG